MIQATSSTSNIYARAPDAPSSPLKKEEPVTVEGNLPKPTRQDLAKPTPARQDLAKPPTPSRQVTPALEQVDAVASEAVWVKRAANECEREFRRRVEIAPKAGVMVHLTTVDGARTTGTLAYDPDCNVVVKIATETLELRRAGGAGAGAPNSSRGLVITWVSSESQTSRRWRGGSTPNQGTHAGPGSEEQRSMTYPVSAGYVIRHLQAGLGSCGYVGQ